MTKREINFIDRVKKKNRRIVAQYLALYTECSHLKKCMITLTAPDNKLHTILDIRKEFFKKLNRFKRNKSTKDLGIKYFSNIEYSKNFIPHLHIQLFFTNKEPINKAYNSIVNIASNNTHTNNLTYANNNTKDFKYVIKDYLQFDLSLEKTKSHYRGIKYTTSSQKTISNNLIRRMFSDSRFNFKTKNRYKEILDLVANGKLEIKNNMYKFIDIKNKSKSETNKKQKNKKSEKRAYKIKIYKRVWKRRPKRLKVTGYLLPH